MNIIVLYIKSVISNENILNYNSKTPTTTQVVLSLGFEALFLLLIFLFIKRVYRNYNRIKKMNTLTDSNNNNSSSSIMNSNKDDIDEKDKYNYEMITMKVDDYEDSINNEKIIDDDNVTANPIHDDVI